MVYVLSLAVLLSVIVVAHKLERGTLIEIHALEGEFQRLASNPGPTNLMPSLDVKLEMLRENPQLSSEVATALNAHGGHPQSKREFHDLFDYFFLIDDLAALSSLVQSYEDCSLIIDHLDFAYLLPASLYERLGCWNWLG